MRKVVLMMIEDGKTPSKEVKAFSKEGVHISIAAPTIQEALKLLEGTEAEAQEAAEAWKQTPQLTTEDSKGASNYMAEAADFMAEYEASAAGKRFLISLQEARKFTAKYGSGGLLCSQVDYLAAKYDNNFIRGSYDVYCYAYRRGYNKAIRNLKAQA